VARLSQHLRFAGLAPKGSPSAFSNAAAGIAAVPIRLNFSVLYQAVRPEKVRRTGWGATLSESVCPSEFSMRHE
jgi:hypothetical protein